MSPPTNKTNNDATSVRKRKLTQTNDQPKVGEEEEVVIEDQDQVEEKEYISRKSLRISSSKAHQAISTPNKSLKPQTATSQITTRSSSQTTTRAKSKSLSIDDSTKLNGAQFVSAAAAGNLNVTNSTTSTNATTSSSSSSSLPSASNPDPDLNKLSQNIDHLNKTIAEHSALFKKLSSSIEDLSNRLDSSIKSANLTKKLNNSSSSFRNRVNKLKQQNLKKQQQNQKIRSIRLRKQKLEELEKIQPDKLKKSNEEKKQKQELETINKEISPTVIEIADEKLIILDDEEIKEDKQPEDNLVQVKLDTETIILSNLPPVVDQPPECTSTTSNTQTTVTLVDTPQISEIEKQDEEKEDDEEEISEDEAPLIIKTIKPVESETSQLKNDQNNQSDQNDDCSTDSSKSDDDDDENEDDESGSKKSRSSSSNSHKGTNIAILNKTKIDTEFISKLIGNKYPNDKRYDPNEINKLRLLSHSYQNFAVKLLVRLFDEEEIIGRNVYGRNYSGDKSITKQPLDPERINFIKETVLRLTKTNNPELAWASCVIAMNRKMVDINNKYLKNLKNKKEDD